MENQSTPIQPDVSQKASPEQAQINQYQETMARMNQVVQGMRDFPITQTVPQVTDDASIITHVEFIPEGGVFTYLQRYEKPFRGFPFNDTVQQIDEFKKLIKIITQKFFATFKKSSLWAKFKLFMSLDTMKSLGIGYLYAYHWQVRKHRLKPSMYCKSVRELHTILSNQSRDILYNDDLREAVRDCFCMFMEFDNAYRFRMQDILIEMDKTALLANPAKEIGRLLQLMADREVAEPGKTKMAEKWKMAKELICLFLRFNQSIANDMAKILSRIDLKEIELTEEDRYYCEFRKDYNFGFMTKGAIPRREVPKGLSTIQAPPTVDKTLEV